jgi:hypothetical protein
VLGLTDERWQLDGGERAHPRCRGNLGQAEVSGDLDGCRVSVAAGAPEPAARDPVGGIGAGDAQHLEAVAPGGSGFQDSGDHLSMVDEVFESLVHHQEPAAAAGSERCPDPTVE